MEITHDGIRAKGKDLVQVHAENSRLREALERARSWMDRQGDSQSGGNHATFDLMMLREERDAITVALAAAPQTPAGLHDAPVAGQCRFAGAQWAECSTEHVRMVLQNPEEWQGYEVRYLYAAPQHATPDDPATKRQEAEAIKAEFLERTGQYLTNDASREACIAEAVEAEREACAKVCEGMHEEDRPHHYADAIRGRDPVPFVPLTTDGERLHFLLDQLTGWGDRTEEVNSYLHDEEGFPLDRKHALASIDAARAKAAAKETP